MKTVTSRKWGGLVIVISLLALLLQPASRLAAQTNPATEESVKVVARLALPGIHVNQMFVQHRDDKDYLYLHRPTRQAFALVDVTSPEKPVLLERAAMQGPASTNVDPANPSLAIAVAQENQGRAVEVRTSEKGQPAAGAGLPTETIRLMDLSNPKHPRVLKTFAGVTSFLPDDSRKLIYIVNQDGLTIVRHRQTRPMPLCMSADALTQEPNCQ